MLSTLSAFVYTKSSRHNALSKTAGLEPWPGGGLELGLRSGFSAASRFEKGRRAAPRRELRAVFSAAASRVERRPSPQLGSAKVYSPPPSK